MTKKKKTLRAAVLASIFAMAFSATAWGNIWVDDGYQFNDQNGKNNGNSTPAVGQIYRNPMPNYTEYGTSSTLFDRIVDGTGIYAYNPTLTDNSGDASNNGTGNFEPTYNYYLQYFAYKDPEPLYVDRIVGIKMNEGGVATQNLIDYGITDTITVKGVQFFHVEYDSSGNIVSPDGLVVTGDNISLAKQMQKKDANGNKLYIKIGDPDRKEVTLPPGAQESEFEPVMVASSDMHYCGESAKSISVGQLQRALEVIYNNDLELSQAFRNEAAKRQEADNKINLEYNEASNTLTFQSGRRTMVQATDGSNNLLYIDADNNITTDVTDTPYMIPSNQFETAQEYELRNAKLVQNVRYDADGKYILVEGKNAFDLGSNGKLEMVISDTEGNIIKGEADIGEYVIENARNAYYTYETNENGDIINPVTIKEAIDNTYTEAKKHTTVENGLNIEITEGTNDDGGKHYKVSTATEVNFDKVTSDVVIAPELHSDIGVIKKVISEAVHSDMAMIGGKVKIDKTGVTMNSTDIIGANNVDTNSITLGDSSTTKITYDGSRITYNDGTEKIANLNDGYYYTGDITTQVNGENPYADLTGKTIKVYGGATTDLVSTTKNIGVTTTQTNAGIDMNLQLAKDIGGFESISVPGANGKDGEDGTTITNEGIVITGPKGDPGKDGKDGTVTVKHDQVDVGGNKIENVAPGELSPDSQDAVNGSQLFNTNQKLDRLGNRVDKVGAGAAALAALHPLDFDPDDKLSFSAGVGNYGGETASALGMFYRPTEKVMLSAAGTMGNGENMVNMGVTFALDRKNNVSNSRVAMAREIQDLREQVAALTALVTQLAGRNNPALMDAVMFPDVPENHWAYDYIEGLQKRGIVEGYPDGNFGGDRSMTRYEYAAMLYRALEKGFPVDSRLLDEFDAELGRIRIDRIKGLDDDGNKIERVRVNQYEDRDDYGSKIVMVSAGK